jgi:outer membrane protein assembly factor BamA
MRKKKKYHCWLILAFISNHFLLAQAPVTDTAHHSTDSAGLPASTSVIIGTITFTGNKKTKAFIMLREIPFRTGEEYPIAVLVKKFEDARKQLMNTTLFNIVVVATNSFEGNKVNVLVTVKERWYLFPVPYLKPVDRNLNQWIVEQKASLSRVNYGAKVLYNNATGRNDKLRMLLISGYTRQASFSYDRLYIDKALKWGMKVGFGTGKNREINYNTTKDKQVFIKDENSFVRSFTGIYTELTYRRAIKTRHSFGLSYYMENVLDTIVALNPGYFKSGRNSTSFPTVSYNMTYYDLDYIPYPTKGYAAHASISKSGINNNVNVWELHARGSGTWPVASKLFFNLNVYGGIKLPFKQPYFNQRFLGYGDTFMQGYEYYVIDGVAGGYVKTTLTRELFNFNIRIPPMKKGKEAERIPVRIFGKVYGNTGYVYAQEPGENLLSNKMLYSGGFGIDILTFYDVTFKLEWTFNQLGQNGIFVHRKSIF